MSSTPSLVRVYLVAMVAVCLCPFLYEWSVCWYPGWYLVGVYLAYVLRKTLSYALSSVFRNLWSRGSVLSTLRVMQSCASRSVSCGRRLFLLMMQVDLVVSAVASSSALQLAAWVQRLLCCVLSCHVVVFAWCAACPSMLRVLAHLSLCSSCSFFKLGC